MRKSLKISFLLLILTLITGALGILVPRSFAEELQSAEFDMLLERVQTKAPSLDLIEFSSTFTKDNQIEVYLKTSRDDVKNIVVSGWSGGAYAKFVTSKNANYDEELNSFVAVFELNEIVNTNTNVVETADNITYSFEAMVYGTNGSMRYYTLDNVEYAKDGLQVESKIENENITFNINAVQEGKIAFLQEGEEITDETKWYDAQQGANTYTIFNKAPSIPSETGTLLDLFANDITRYRIAYMAGGQTTLRGVDTENDTPIKTTLSTFQNDDTFTFDISTVNGEPSWISYDDTPEIFESTIQGMGDTQAVATIKIATQQPGFLSFDYNVSSESTFDKFSYQVSGASTTTVTGSASNTAGTISGSGDWKHYRQSFATPPSGEIILVLTYSKDKNVNAYEDRAMIRNLSFVSIMPTNGRIIINNGDDYTETATVNVDISVEGANSYYLSETKRAPEVSDSNWQPLTSTTTYTFSDSEDGTKTLYAWFKNENNTLSSTYSSDTIILDTAAPTNLAPIAESTKNEITVTLKQTDANPFTSIEYGYRVLGDAKFDWVTSNRNAYTITGLQSATTYEVATRVSDGFHTTVTSETTQIKTKIPADGITITRTPFIKTTGNVVVDLAWNNTTYSKRYSLDGTNFTNTTQDLSLEFENNGTLYYEMYDSQSTTGVQEYKVDNIDREGPKVREIGVTSPRSGKYGVDDIITITLIWDEEVIYGSAPTLNIKFDDNVIIPLHAIQTNATTVVYQYTITLADAGYLVIDSLTGGLVKDSLDQIASYEFTQTGNRIFAENAVINETTNVIYANVQNAVNGAQQVESRLKLLSDTELATAIVIEEGQSIILDLNGKTISINEPDNIVRAFLNNGALTIKDSVGTGKIIATSEEKSVHTIENGTNGSLTLLNVKVESNSNAILNTFESCAVYNKGIGTVTLGNDEGTVSVETPSIIAKGLNGIALNSTSRNGVVNFYDGILKGTKNSIKLSEGANSYNLPTGYFENIESVIEEGTNYIVSTLSNNYKVELTMNGQTVGYPSVLNAVEKIPADGRLGKLKMLDNETLTDILKINNGQNIELDLNGHTITATQEIGGGVYAILNNGTLAIKNSSATRAEIKAITNADCISYAIYNATNGTVSLDGVRLFAQNLSSTKNSSAYGLYVVSGSQVVDFYDAEIYNSASYISIANLRMCKENYYIHFKREMVDEKSYYVTYTSNEAGVKLTVGSDTFYYGTIQEAVNASPTNGTEATIQMLQSQTLSETIKVLTNKRIVLDLNGKCISGDSLTNTIKSSGEYLNIIDTDTNHTSYISGYTVICNAYTKNVSISGTKIFSSNIALDNINKGTTTCENVEIIMKGENRSQTAIKSNTSGSTIICNHVMIASSNSNCRYTGINNYGGSTVEFRNGSIMIETASVNDKIIDTRSTSNNVIIENSTLEVRYSADMPSNGAISNGGTLEIANTQINLIGKGESCAIQNFTNGQISINDVVINLSNQQTGNSKNYDNTIGIYNQGIINISSGDITATSDIASHRTVYSLACYSNSTTTLNSATLRGKVDGIYMESNISINNDGSTQTDAINIPQNTYISRVEEDGYVVNTIEPCHNVVTLNIGGTVTNHTSLQDAIDYAPTNANLAKITLLENIYIPCGVEISEGKNIEIDLNGYTITAFHTAIKNSGEVYILDNSINKEGKILSYGKAVLNLDGANVTIDGIPVISTRGYDYFIDNSGDGDIVLNKIVSYTVSGSGFTGSYITNRENGNIQIIDSSIDTPPLHYGLHNMGSGNIEVYNSTVNKAYFCVYNTGLGSIRIIGSSMEANQGGGGTAIYNSGIGTIEIESSNITKGITNWSNGTILVKSGTIVAEGNAINNQSNGTIIVQNGLVSGKYGIYNSAKGTIIVGTQENYENNTKEPRIRSTASYISNLNEKYGGIVLTTLGADVQFNSGYLMSYLENRMVYPMTTSYEAISTPSEVEYVVDIPDDATMTRYYINGYYCISPEKTITHNYLVTYMDTQGITHEEYYSTLPSVQSAIPSNIETTVKLLKNNTEDTVFTIAASKNVVFDLNGNKLTINSNTGFSINGTLTFVDNSENGGGILDVYGSTTSCTAVSVGKNGSVILGKNDNNLQRNLFMIKSNWNGISSSGGGVKMYDGIIWATNKSCTSYITAMAGHTTHTQTLEDGSEMRYVVPIDSNIVFYDSSEMWTNQNVKITVKFPTLSNAQNKYKINDGEWNTITSSSCILNFEENAIIYAQQFDRYGTLKTSGEYRVSNIDKQVPTITNVSLGNLIDEIQQICINGIIDNVDGSGICGYIISQANQTPEEDSDWIACSTENVTTEVNKNGTWYIWVMDRAGNISERKSIIINTLDIERPIVNYIEIVSPSYSNCSVGTEILFNVKFNKNIIVNATPILKIRFGNGVTRICDYEQINSDSLVYTYTIQSGDGGLMSLASLTNVDITDGAGNLYLETDIELIGTKIVANAKAYIPSTNTYYASLLDAINSCPNDATEYTTIQLLDNEKYSMNHIITNVGQKIEIDLVGHELLFSNYWCGIRNNGDMILKNGTISGDLILNDTNYFIYNSGSIYLENMQIKQSSASSTKMYGIYSSSSGVVRLKNTDITMNAYCVYFNSQELLEIDGGKFKSGSNSIAVNVLTENSTIILRSGEWIGGKAGLNIHSNYYKKVNNSGTVNSGEINIPQNMHIGYDIENGVTKNYLEDGGIVASLEVNGVITNYASVVDAFANAPIDGTLAKIKLYHDYCEIEQVKVLTGNNIILDLNGCEFASINRETIFCDGGTIEIQDNSLTHSGKVMNYSTTSITTNAENHSSVTLQGVKVETTSTYAISLNNGTLAVLNSETGGVLSSNTNSTVLITNSQIKGKSYGINNSKSNIEINNSTIEAEKYGIYVTSGETTLNGVNIVATGTTSYGLYLNGVGTVNYNEETIRGKTAAIHIPEGVSVSSSGTKIYGSINLPLGKYLNVYEEEGFHVAILSVNPTIKMETGGNTTYYSLIQDAILAAPSENIYAKMTLLNSIETASGIVIPSGKNIEIDLNGYSIYSNGLVKPIENRGIIKFTDNTSGESSIESIISTSASGVTENYLIYNYSSGKLTINNVDLSCNYVSKNGYGIYNNGEVEINNVVLEMLPSSDTTCQCIVNKAGGKMTIDGIHLRI